MSVTLDAGQNPGSLEDFLNGLRGEIAGSSPGALDLFDVFAQEARICRAWLESSLRNLPVGSQVLEVGAGLMLLACQLQREGFMVTALEPIGPGFTIFAKLQKKILDYAAKERCAPSVLPIPVEELDIEHKFSFAYSFNVMEHVADVPVALARVTKALMPGGQYRFTCPNYLFPYEPHFNMPTLFSKRLTGWAFRSTIRKSTLVSDPEGTWNSLNWITVPQIRRVLSRMDHVAYRFDRAFLERTLARIVSDPVFAARRSVWLRSILGVAVHLGLHRLARLIPATLQPIIDCRVTAEEES